MCRILLVEDEYLEREVLKIIISSNIEGASIVGEAQNGKVAVQMCEELKPDIVFMDIKIPGINGIDASKIIKSKDKDIVIIFFSAYAEADVIHKCMNAGGNEYISKPCRPERIINIVNKYKDKLKNKADFMVTTKKELIQFIIAEDYKGAKIALNKLVDNIQIMFSSDVNEFKACCKEVAMDIIRALENINFKNQSKNFDDKKLLKEMLPLLDYYLIRSWLFKVLDAVFEMIISNKTSSMDNELKAALNYIEKNYFKRITLEEVAAYINFSPFYLSKQFKKEIGVNFIDYVTELKMEKAKELLANTDIPIINIALELSYNEQNYFSRVFRKFAGMAPSEYRDKVQKLGSRSENKNLLSKNVSTFNTK